MGRGRKVEQNEKRWGESGEKTGWNKNVVGQELLEKRSFRIKINPNLAWVVKSRARSGNTRRCWSPTTCIQQHSINIASRSLHLDFNSATVGIVKFLIVNQDTSSLFSPSEAPVIEKKKKKIRLRISQMSIWRTNDPRESACNKYLGVIAQRCNAMHCQYEINLVPRPDRGLEGNTYTSGTMKSFESFPLFPVQVLHSLWYSEVCRDVEDAQAGDILSGTHLATYTHTNPV